MFIGEYFHNIDDKGRINFPVKLREELGSQFVLTKGLDGCLSAYSMDEWEKISEKLSALPHAKARDLKRFMFSSASIVSTDKQGRILVNPSLKIYSGLRRDVTIIGASDHVEIWDRDAWEERNSRISSDDIALAMDELGF